MTKKFFIPWLVIAALVFSTVTVYAAAPLIEDYQREKEETREKINLNVIAMETAAVKAGEDAVKKAEAKIAAEKKAKAEARAAAKREKYIRALSGYIQTVNRNINDSEAYGMASAFVRYGEEYRLDAELVMAVAQNESTFYKDAVSAENFKGLMQTGDGLARNAGYAPSQLFDYDISIKVGTRYLRIKLDEFGDKCLALTAYNQGSGSVHSGNYSTGYAELAISRADAIKRYVNTNLKKS